MRLLCIHHEPTSDGGTLLEPARAGGWAIEHWRANAGEPRPILAGVDAVIAYGGTMNPDDDQRLAWLADVRATLAEAVARDLPVLGVCLGAQLLSQALGAGAPKLERPELGWYRVDVTGAGADDVLIGPLAPSCEVFQWHDYGCDLPEGAVPLARSERAPQQAYRLGDAVWAVQFHIDVDAALVERWTGFAPDLVRAHGSEPAALVARARAYEAEYVGLSRALMGRFLTVARTREARPVAEHPLRVPVEGGVVAGSEAGAGTPILLLHGLGGTGAYWHRTMQLLAGRARLIALDLPGFGESDATPGGFALDTASDRLAEALAALGGAPAVVCGHSMGGPLAVRLAVRHPGAVSRLILAAPSGFAPAPAWQHRVARVLPLYRALQRTPFRWERWLLPLAPLRRAALVPLVDRPANIDPAVMRSLLEGARVARDLPAAAVVSLAAGLAEEVAHATAPIAAIWGDHDRLVPAADAELLLRAVPSAAIHILPACGHMPMIERPEAFAALLARLALE